jgi:hypothetical protein
MPFYTRESFRGGNIPMSHKDRRKKMEKIHDITMYIEIQ